MFNFETAKAQTLANIIRALQEDTNTTISATSTLLRLKRTAMVSMIDNLCGDVFVIADDGTVTPAPTVEAEFQAALDDEGIDPVEVEAPAEVVPSPPAEVTPAKVNGHRGKQPQYTADMVIKVLIDHNPRRLGTAGYARFAQFKTGITVGAYLAAVGAAGGNVTYARGTLIKAVRKGQVAVA